MGCLWAEHSAAETHKTRTENHRGASTRARTLFQLNDGDVDGDVDENPLPYDSKEGTFDHNEQTVTWLQLTEIGEDVDILHHQSKSCKKATRGKGGGTPTCTPSTVPTQAPTKSAPPSPMPSSPPTPAPTHHPTKQPTNAPTLSKAPSTFPTKEPTVPPTPTPTSLPSQYPTRSPQPSHMPSPEPTTQPTDSPTRMPSISPTEMPSTSPTMAPSDNPTKFSTNHPTQRPSQSPTATVLPSTVPTQSPTTIPPSSIPTVPPTEFPTVSPSSSPAPSDSPTGMPSATPSVSNEPTLITFVTDDSDGLVSLCEATPPTGTVEEQRLVFQYNLYVTEGSDPDAALSQTEESLHYGMARNFLLCEFDVAASYYIVSVVSKPDDTISDEACDVSNDPSPPVDSDCHLVTAELSMLALFPPSRRQLRQLQQSTIASPDVLDDSATFLRDSMAGGDYNDGDVVQVAFQGFLNVEQDGVPTPPASDPGTANVAGITDGDTIQSNANGSNVALGSAVVGLAALCLMVATVISVRYRNNRREAYLKHLENMSQVSDLSLGDEQLEKGVTPLGDGRVNLVNTDLGTDDDDDDEFEAIEVDSLEEIIRELQDEERAHIDVHQCSSATCPICRSREVRPTFIAASYGPEVIADLKGGSLISDSGQRSYQSPDTILL